MSELPNTTIKPHHIRHIISGTIVFVLCVAADIFLLELKRSTETKQVIWSNGEIEELKAASEVPLPNVGSNVDFGFVGDGTVVWRYRK